MKLGKMLEDRAHAYQALDSSAMPVRDAKRRGHGWPERPTSDGLTAIGWYEGFSVLAAIEPSGVITGFCFGSASSADQPLAETFFAVRTNPNPRLISVGAAFSGIYVADKGFEGTENHRRWLECYGAEVVHPPKRNSKSPGPSILGSGWLPSVRSWRRSTTSSSMPSVCGGSVPTRSGACGRVWREGGSAQLLHLAQ